MTKWGVDRGVLLPIATKPSQQRIINDWASEQDGGRFIAFGSIHPDAEDFAEELDRIKTIGLHGIKLHPDYQDFMVNDRKLDPVYDEITRLELPVTFHAGYDCVSPDLIHCPPELAREAADRHKGMKMIFAHLGGNGEWDKVLDIWPAAAERFILIRALRLIVKTNIMEKIIKKHGSDRILFASDCPWQSPALIAQKIDSLKLSDGDKEKIYYKNAMRLLKLQ